MTTNEWFPLVGPVVAAIVAVLGWFVGYRLNARQDQKTKRQELRIPHLIAAYRHLESATKTGATETVLDLDSAVSDIRLFGSDRQIELVNQVVEAPGVESAWRYEQLLGLLRQELRQELGMEKKAVSGILPHATTSKANRDDGA